MPRSWSRETQEIHSRWRCIVLFYNHDNSFARSLGDKKIQRKADEIALSKQTVKKSAKELSDYVSQQLNDLVKTCTFFSLALDESTDMCDVAQLSIFI